MANQLTPNNPLVQEIRELVKNARTTVVQQVNTQLLSTYWQIGRGLWNTSSKASSELNMENRH